MEIDLNQRIDISKIQNVLIGNKNEILQKYLSEEINNLFKSANSKDNFPTNHNLLFNLCPKLFFGEFETIFDDFKNKAFKLTNGINIVNVYSILNQPNKSEDYFSSLIIVLCIKHITNKLEEMSSKFKEKLIKIQEEVNSYENRKYTLQLRNQVEYLINESIIIKRTNSPNSNQNVIKNNFTNYSKNDVPSSKNLYPNYNYSTTKANNFSSIESKNPSQYNLLTINNIAPANNSPVLIKDTFSRDRIESRSGHRAKNSFSGRQPILNTFIKNISERSLTQNIWPKSKMLLSIASKLFKENFITIEQRGVLKELILDQDPNLINILTNYENTRNYKNLCESITKLISLSI